jgi:hypothetical protein
MSVRELLIRSEFKRRSEAVKLNIERIKTSRRGSSNRESQSRVGCQEIGTENRRYKHKQATEENAHPSLVRVVLLPETLCRQSRTDA